MLQEQRPSERFTELLKHAPGFGSPWLNTMPARIGRRACAARLRRLSSKVNPPPRPLMPLVVLADIAVCPIEEFLVLMQPVAEQGLA